MKILHIFDTAGVGTTISETMDQLYGTKSKVLTTKGADPYHMAKIHSRFSGKLFLLSAFLQAYPFDVVWCHYNDRLISPLRRFYGKKVLIMHYHGDDIRIGGWKKSEPFWGRADLIFISTPDLAELPGAPDVTLVPAPVDTRMFTRPVGITGKGAVCFRTWQPHQDFATMLRNAEKNGLSPRVVDRHQEVIPHDRMPAFLSSFEYLIDQAPVAAFSRTALEALALGLKVIRWDGSMVEGLPDSWKPENVSSVAYRSILKARR